MHNIYYNPESCGLNQVGCLDEADLSYEYNTLIVVEEIQSGKMFWAQDSGCPCPTPFEDYRFVSADDNNLSALNKETLDSFINEVKNFPATLDERQSLIRKVKYRLSK
ncbi:MAG: hypothetical protein V4490_00670 [Pseudomonadota bacterium]